MLKPRLVHVQRTEARLRNERGGELGRIAWEEHAAACARRKLNPERVAARGGLDYAAVTLLLGHEPRTWRPWLEPEDERRGPSPEGDS